MNRLWNGCALIGLCLLALANQRQVVGGDESPKEPQLGAAASGGVIRAVTLYREQALVTREVAIAAGPPLRTFVVTGLPAAVAAESVRAEGDGQLSVRSLRVANNRPLPEDDESTRKFLQQIQELTDRQAELKASLAGTDMDLESLGQLVSFGAATAKSDLSLGVLNADTLIQLSNFALDKRRELSAERFRQQKQLKELESQLTNAQGELAAVQRGLPLSYDAVLLVESPNGAAGMLWLTYSVGGCGWSPEYVVHAQLGKPEIELRYTAKIWQNTGESWPGVALTLSSHSPSVSSERPLLRPFQVSIGAAPARNQSLAAADDPFGTIEDDEAEQRQPGPLSERIAEVRSKMRTSQDNAADSTHQSDPSLNLLAGEMQEIELLADAESWRALAPDVNDEIASQVLTLPQPVDLLSQELHQFLPVMKTALACEIHHVATPLLSSFAFREATVKNSQPNSLLAGPATVFLDSRFVGKSQIPSTASGQSLTIGLGADNQVRTRRELVEKSDAIKGGNRNVKFTYRLVVSNFKEIPISVRLYDRMPKVRQSHLLSVALGELPMPLSNEALYLRMDRPMGILRWDLEVPAERHGSQAFDVPYAYTLEYDRTKLPSARDALAELQAEYDSKGWSGGGGLGGGGFGGK